MTVNVTAIPNTGTRRRSHSIIPNQGDDYVLSGGSLSYNGTTLTVGGGEATISNGDVVYAVAWGDTTFTPSSDGSVYLDVQDPDLTDGQATGALVGPDTAAPSAPRLELGSVDVSAGTTTAVNRSPTQSFQSVNTETSVTVTAGEASNTIHYGSNQDRANSGDNSVAIGIGARANGDNVTAAGYKAAKDNTGNRVTAIGGLAARDNTGKDVTATGFKSARDNTGKNVTATGYRAARDNTGTNVTATGLQAAQNNAGNSVTATGREAARNNTGKNVTAAGREAAKVNTGNNVTAAGFAAARGDGLADPTTMGDDNIGIGESAIRNNQASGLIAIGQDAGINAQTDDQLIITQRDGTRRMVMDLTTGDLQISGTLTENATL